MAEIVRRRSWGGVLPLGRHVSISGSSFIQCASASIAPPHPGGAKCYPGAEVQGRAGSSVGEKIRDGRLVDEASLRFAINLMEALLHEVQTARIMASQTENVRPELNGRT